MRKICFYLFAQASLIAFLFYFHSHENEKAVNQNWGAFLDAEMEFQNQQRSSARRYAYKTSRKSEASRIFFDALIQLEKNLNSLSDKIQFSTNEEVIQTTMDSMKIQIETIDVDFFKFHLEELIDYYQSGSKDLRSLQKELQWSIDKTLNDLSFSMMQPCNLFVNRFNFELIKGNQQSKLYLIGEYPTLNFEADVYIDDQFDVNIYGNTSITRTAKKEGKNFLSIMVKNGENSSLKKFEYYVFPNNKLDKP